jgi:hypothetical protein
MIVSLVFVASVVLSGPTLRMYLTGGVDATTAVLRWIMALAVAACGARLLGLATRTTRVTQAGEDGPADGD